MAQSAPVNDVSAVSKKEMNQIKLENILYCSAQSLHHAREDLVKAKLILHSPPQADINENIKTTMNKIFHQFSKLCKYFTKAMVLKHQLQEHLFSTSTDSALKIINSDNHNNISTILTSLQTMANIFDDIKTHSSESRGQEEAGLRDEPVSYLQVAPL